MASTLLEARSASNADHTSFPANPSTVKPFWFSKFITAALVITFSEPSVHSEVNEAGSEGQRQANEPGWTEVARLGELSGALGLKLKGR